MTAELVSVSPEYLPAIDGDIRPLLLGIEKRCRGHWTADAMIGRFETGEWQLWIFADGPQILGLVGTRIYRRDDGNSAAEILFGTGIERERWQHLMAGVEDWARELGCVVMTSVARPGWARVLPGYRVTHVLMEKDLVG